MGPNVSDTYVFFAPLETWREVDGRKIKKAELAELMRRELVAVAPGQTYLFTQPIQMRFNEIMAGARADLSLKIYGDDYTELERLATAARDVLRGVAGGGDVEFEALGRVPMLGNHAEAGRSPAAQSARGRDQRRRQHRPRRRGCGIDHRGQQALPVVVRLPETERLNLAGLKSLPVLGEDGVQVPLERVADITVADRIGTINREDTQRRVGILINVRGRDTEGFVLEAQAEDSRTGQIPARLLF
jgi:cobalt-zinc-cadmium resistance protein CzcA